MKRLIIAAAGLALVGGIIIGGTIGNPLGTTAQRTSAADVTGSGCYTNWNAASCAAGWTAVSTGVWTVVWIESTPISGGLICATDRPHVEGSNFNQPIAATRRTQPDGYWIEQEPCATCCATGPSVVGGVAEAPDFAAGASGMGGGAYAVLGAVGGVLAITVAGTVAAKRRGVQH